MGRQWIYKSEEGKHMLHLRIPLCTVIMIIEVYEKINIKIN